MTQWVNEVWSSDLYQRLKRENFTVVESHLTQAPKKILDIGCGLAWESRMFNEKFGSELWLIDGDTRNNDQKSAKAAEGSYHTDPNYFLYYHPLDFLDVELKKLNTRNYQLIDCNNINIDESIKFDLITSWLSCGFHYPLTTYKDLILKHSHENTKVIMDIRKKKDVLVIEDDVKIVAKLNQRKKYITCEIKFL